MQTKMDQMTGHHVAAVTDKSVRLVPVYTDQGWVRSYYERVEGIEPMVFSRNDPGIKVGEIEKTGGAAFGMALDLVRVFFPIEEGEEAPLYFVKIQEWQSRFPAK